ncbi:MAG: hypothetical protein WBF06_00690 [Candidatus Acidiferrales bacterium]
MPGVEEFTSASDVNQFLSKLVHLLAQDRISPRRGAVLIYGCNLLLHTLRAIERERDPKFGEKEDLPIIWDIPGPDRENDPPPA